MPDTPKTVVAELGKALSALHSWYSSTDIEALQTLLCIQMLADDNGYAQLVEVRRQVGTHADKMTRCVRLLMGQKKSTSLSLLGANPERQPLVIMTSYDDAPSVKRLALTPLGSDIVNRLAHPLIEREDRIKELEAKVEEAEHIRQGIRELGFNADKLASAESENRVFTQRAHSLLRAILKGLSSLSATELYNLNVPEIQDQVLGTPGFNLDGDAENNAEAKKQLDLSFAILHHETKGEPR